MNEMIKTNEYFGGKVKSLGFERDGVPFTVGVVLPGAYTFDTQKEEHLTITVGTLDIQPPGKDWQTAPAGTTIVIAAGSKFQLKAEKPVSYVCQYK
jgi:purine/pyrimidine-nucleoside phosphorylase